MKENKITEYLVEVRFVPNSKVLDKRGDIASQVSLSTDFDHWNIGTNKISFTNSKKEKIYSAFGFKNLGVLSKYPNDQETFLNETKSFIKTCWNFYDSSQTIRIGVKTKYLIEIDSFKKAFDAYRKKFLHINDKDIANFGGDLIDVGFPLNFADGENFFNVTTGPMQKKEFEQFIDVPEDVFDSGIYIDVDYFTTEISPNIRQKDLFEFIEKAVGKAETVSENIINLLSESND